MAARNRDVDSAPNSNTTVNIGQNRTTDHQRGRTNRASPRSLNEHKPHTTTVLSPLFAKAEFAQIYLLQSLTKQPPDGQANKTQTSPPLSSLWDATRSPFVVRVARVLARRSAPILRPFVVRSRPSQVRLRPFRRGPRSGASPPAAYMGLEAPAGFVCQNR